jgi:hypothetical protein
VTNLTSSPGRTSQPRSASASPVPYRVVIREAIYAAGQGMLGIWVLKERQIVAVTHVTWLG